METYSQIDSGGGIVIPYEVGDETQFTLVAIVVAFWQHNKTSACVTLCVGNV